MVPSGAMAGWETAMPSARTDHLRCGPDVDFCVVAFFPQEEKRNGAERIAPNRTIRRRSAALAGRRLDAGGSVLLLGLLERSARAKSRSLTPQKARGFGMTTAWDRRSSRKLGSVGIW